MRFAGLVEIEIETPSYSDVHCDSPTVRYIHFRELKTLLLTNFLLLSPLLLRLLQREIGQRVELNQLRVTSHLLLWRYNLTIATISI